LSADWNVFTVADTSGTVPVINMAQTPGKARAAVHHDVALDALQQHDFDLSWVA